MPSRASHSLVMVVGALSMLMMLLMFFVCGLI